MPNNEAIVLRNVQWFVKAKDKRKRTCNFQRKQRMFVQSNKLKIFDEMGKTGSALSFYTYEIVWQKHLP